MTEVWKIRFDKITYGLIYPAFFGNMVYDLLLRKLAWSDKALESANLWTCLLILVFLIVDYMHLQGDMNEIVIDAKGKTWRYIICDIITSTLIFLSFVFIKEGLLVFGIISFTTIPFLILTYKWKNRNSRVYFLIYSSIAIAFAILILILIISGNSAERYILTYSFFSTTAYLFYITFYYEKKCKPFDIVHMKGVNAKY